MNLIITIESAENMFKQILEEFFISVFDEKSLSSHGIDHHRRVWSYTKELLPILAEQKPSLTEQLPSKLIIASYLHDIGMSIETGIRHGRHSRDICIQFLKQNKLLVDDYQEVLEAIENHDNKNYSKDSDFNDLLKILSGADDLDAFGFIGIFRYAEIYMKRGNHPEKIGRLIMDNAGMRFENLMKTFGYANGFVGRHKKRYEILYRFYEEYNKQVPSYKFGGTQPSGYCGVIEMFIYILNNKLALEDFYIESNKYSIDPIICMFFKNLANELHLEY
jgi:HD superfamily phosphodiesterase